MWPRLERAGFDQAESFSVTRGLDPRGPWIAGSSPAMTIPMVNLIGTRAKTLQKGSDNQPKPAIGNAHQGFAKARALVCPVST